MTQARKEKGLTVAITSAGSGLGRELALGFSATDDCNHMFNKGKMVTCVLA